MVATDEGTVVEVVVDVADVELWWPHTHGDQPLYDVALELSGDTHRLGRVGFRTVTVDREGGAFTFHVNGVPVFARGTSWVPPDPVGLAPSDERLRHNVDLLRAGSHSMVRVSGVGVWESAAFLDLLDEQGILLWQDCMFAFVDVPDDPVFLADVAEELDQAFTELQGRPCLALVCGGADTEEQAVYHGVPLDQCASLASAVTVPGRLDALLPGTPYLAATPGGSAFPTAVNAGVSHYFGVGGYARPLSDARAAGVRFASERLPLATPPEDLDPMLEAAANAGYGRVFDPRAAVHRDAGAPWDLQDVLGHYTHEVLGVDVLALRQRDPERATELFRATAVHLYEQVLAEWRRPGSPCAGALTLYGHDLRLGPGIGLVDALDRPKATWYALRRVMRPVALLLVDEGFSGLDAVVVNDTAALLAAELRVDLHRDGELLLESASTRVVVPARGAVVLPTSTLFGSFRDLSYAHRFGDPAADVVSASLLDGDGTLLGRGLPPARSRAARALPRPRPHRCGRRRRGWAGRAGQHPALRRTGAGRRPRVVRRGLLVPPAARRGADRRPAPAARNRRRAAGPDHLVEQRQRVAPGLSAGSLSGGSSPRSSGRRAAPDSAAPARRGAPPPRRGCRDAGR